MLSNTVIYEKPKSYFSDAMANKLALEYKDDPNYPYMDELASIVLFSGNPNLHQAAEWYENIGTHKDYIANLFVATGDANVCANFAINRHEFIDEMYAVVYAHGRGYHFGKWCADIDDKRNINLKIQTVLLGGNNVDDFIDSYNRSIRLKQEDYCPDTIYYTRKDFYSDLPLDLQMGVLI